MLSNMEIVSTFFSFFFGIPLILSLFFLFIGIGIDYDV